MNRRQLAFVLAGLLIFVAGAFVGFTPFEGPQSGAPALVLPLAQPLEAVTVRPGPALLALALPVLGVAVALLGCYAARGRR